jgi:hypothetical protein
VLFFKKLLYYALAAILSVVDESGGAGGVMFRTELEGGIGEGSKLAGVGMGVGEWRGRGSAPATSATAPSNGTRTRKVYPAEKMDKYPAYG